MKTIARIIAFNAILLATHLSFGAGQADVFVSKPGRVTLVELFTSEGCSSCPPAEQWFSHFLDDKTLWTDVIPMAMHVDYWDYLGWEDRFADPAFSARQRLYKATNHINAVYTPGFVVNGEEWRGFFNPLWRNTPLHTAEGPEPGILVLTRSNETIRVEYPDGADQALVANVAYLGSGLEQSILRGENAGKVLTHNFVVLAMARQTGQRVFEFHLPPPARANALIAFLTRPGDPQPIQAVGGEIRVNP